MPPRKGDALSVRALPLGLTVTLGLLLAVHAPVGAWVSEAPPMTRRDFVQELHPLVMRLEAQGAIARSNQPSITVFADLEGKERDRATELASQFHLFVAIPALSSGRFNGILPVSRWEAGTVMGELLARLRPEARELLPVTPPGWRFEDLSPIEAHRLEPVITRGLLIGFPDRTFRTLEPLTREQWAAISAKLAPLGTFQARQGRRAPASLKDDFKLIRQESHK